MNSCLCDSLSSKLLFMWYFSYFIHPLYPSQRGGRSAFFREILLNFFFCKRNQFTCFVSSEYGSSSSGNTFKKKTACDIHVPNSVYSHVVMCYWKKEKKQLVLLYYWAITCQYASSQRPSVFSYSELHSSSLLLSSWLVVRWNEHHSPFSLLLLWICLWNAFVSISMLQ